MWDRSQRPEGGEWEPIKISSEIQTVSLYPENHPQAFWPKFGIAMEKLNQHKRPRTCERNHEANRKRTRKSADLADSDRSDRSLRPVRPVGLEFKNPDRSDRLHPDRSQTKLQTANLEQTKSKSNETWRIASHLPVNISPKDLSQKINRL